MEKQDYDPKVTSLMKHISCSLLITYQCYLCPGNQRATGDRNPDYTGTFLFENDYSTVRMSERDYIAEGHKSRSM
jgi:galactose-1-phosphate uridylyltransferase